MKAITREMLEQWLDDLNVRYFICPDCDGIHLTDMEENLGVLESRILVESDLLILTTELAVRPSAVLPLHGSMHLINLDNPLVKVVLHMNDDDVPQLVISAALPSKGLPPVYFGYYLKEIQHATTRVLDNATQMDVLFLDDMDLDTTDGDPLH